MLLPRQVLGGFSVLGLAALAWVLTRTVAQPVRRMVVMAERIEGEFCALQSEILRTFGKKPVNTAA